eukprot:TRINITY_DN3976_c9_g1_i1.p1 TRINITY_DN3976_c9_g1~~TRINITY_DN3976_c9_g1_i1.p1  ORF type:complete len:376 (+),score=38.41 TRINITY_DN3976_c9_g1_i1:155-1129(+)
MKVVCDRGSPNGITLWESQIHVGGGETLNVLKGQSSLPSRGKRVAMVLHGFAGGSAMWAKNINEIVSACDIAYFVDLPGFGRSSRKGLSFKDATNAEDYFLSRIHKLQKILLEELCHRSSLKFTFVGHSFGGHLSACYALKYPSLVDKVILCDPWGVAVQDSRGRERLKKLPWVIKTYAAIASRTSPLFMLRAIGPLGPGLLPRFRKDLVRNWGKDYPNGEMETYIYQCNAASPPTGEHAFMKLQIPFAWAKKPLVNRIDELSKHDIPIHYLFGEHTWMDKQVARDMSSRYEGISTYDIVPGAGHHIYLDNPSFFNSKVQSYLE